MSRLSTVIAQANKLGEPEQGSTYKYYKIGSECGGDVCRRIGIGGVRVSARVKVARFNAAKLMWEGCKCLD